MDLTLDEAMRRYGAAREAQVWRLCEQGVLLAHRYSDDGPWLFNVV